MMELRIDPITRNVVKYHEGMVTSMIILNSVIINDVIAIKVKTVIVSMIIIIVNANMSNASAVQ